MENRYTNILNYTLLPPRYDIGPQGHPDANCISVDVSLDSIRDYNRLSQSQRLEEVASKAETQTLLPRTISWVVVPVGVSTKGVRTIRGSAPLEKEGI